MGALLILLNILKIIGIILLIILILIVTLLCIVLFVPFVYNVEGEKYQQIRGNGYIKWLFGIICLEFVYANGETDLIFKIFGKSLEDIKKDRVDKKRGKHEKKSKKRNEGENKKTEKPQVRVVASEKKIDVQPEMESVSILKEEPVVIAEPEIFAMGNLSEEKTIVKRVKLKKIEGEIPEDITVEEKEENNKEEIPSEEEATNENRGKVVKEKIDIEYFKKIPWEEKKQIFNACTKLLKRLFKGILPNSVYVDATVGVGDPSLTGHILALAAIAKGIINSNINVRGKFDQEIFEGKLRIAGGIKIFNIISALAKFIFTKSIYKIWRTYLKGRGE